MKNWKNLKQNKCPECNTVFGYTAFSKRIGYIVCSQCGYTISNKRFSEIVNSQITEELQRKWEKESEE